MTDYERICDFQNLYHAHMTLRLGKRNKTEVIRYELELARNLIELSEHLKNRTYKMQGYYHFQVHEPKTRDVFAAYYPDRVLLKCICDQVVTPVLQNRVIYDNAACQKGKGTHFALKRVTKFLAEHYKKHGAQGYALKCDITKYFASIDHATLKSKLDKVILDPEIRAILFDFIDNHHTEGRPGVGLPLGNHSSQWFAIYYLDRADRFIKEELRVKHYIRYMDDILLIHPSKEFLNNALRQMIEVIEGELKLTLNDKTRIFPIRDGVEFLGWRFYITETGKIVRKVKAQTRLRFRRRVKKLQNDYNAGLIELEDVRNSLASYKGHFKHGHAYKFNNRVFKDFVLKRDEKPNDIYLDEIT